MPHGIQPNTVAYVKTTDEPVYIIAIGEKGEVTLRRPVQGQAGINHHLENDWFAGELHTSDERLKARYLQLKAEDRVVRADLDGEDIPAAALVKN